MSQRGFVHLALPVVLLLIVGAVILGLLYFGIIKNPFQNLSFLSQGPKVALKKEYKNPFDKETQYVNPFEKDYKNPFVVK